MIGGYGLDIRNRKEAIESAARRLDRTRGDVGGGAPEGIRAKRLVEQADRGDLGDPQRQRLDAPRVEDPDIGVDRETRTQSVGRNRILDAKSGAEQQFRRRQIDRVQHDGRVELVRALRV